MSSFLALDTMPIRIQIAGQRKVRAQVEVDKDEDRGLRTKTLSSVSVKDIALALYYKVWYVGNWHFVLLNLAWGLSATNWSARLPPWKGIGIRCWACKTLPGFEHCINWDNSIVEIKGFVSVFFSSQVFFSIRSPIRNFLQNLEVSSAFGLIGVRQLDGWLALLYRLWEFWPTYMDCTLA